MLAVTALAHGYAVLWAGLAATYFLFFARKPWRTLLWLGAVGALAFSLAGLTLVPLLADWSWTTPYDDAWITMTTRNTVPRTPARSEKVVRKEMKVLERTIAQLDEQKRDLNAKLLESTDAEEALRLHNEIAALTEQLSPAEERWCELQARIEDTD
jgi:hypothetical protein